MVSVNYKCDSIMSTGIETVSSTYTQTPRKETLKASLLTELLPCKYTRTVPWPVKTPSIISELVPGLWRVFHSS